MAEHASGKKTGRLEDMICDVQRDFERCKFKQVAKGLKKIDDLVENSPRAFKECADNLDGEIQARVRTTFFTMTKIQ